jgi:transcriptional regulator with XRE-family HTH domain
VLPQGFAQAARAARQRIRLTQKELSDKLGTAGTHAPARIVGAWENGYREPSVDEVYALEEALDLPEHTLLLRLRGASPEARDLYARFSPESLFYVTTMVTEHVHVGLTGAVERIEVTRRIRALRPMRTCFVAHAEDNGRHRIRVVPRLGCTTGNRRPLMKDRVEVRLELDTPMVADEERILRYDTVHTYYGGQTRQDQEHRHNGTHMHTLIAITASFATTGVRITMSTGRDRNAAPVDVQSYVLCRRKSPLMQWRYPGEVGCIVSWELRP